jgi:hypothetical protein
MSKLRLNSIDLALGSGAALAIIAYLLVRLVQTWTTHAGAFPVVIPWGYLTLGALFAAMATFAGRRVPTGAANGLAMLAVVLCLIAWLATVMYSYLEHGESHRAHVGGMILFTFLAGLATVGCMVAMTSVWRLWSRLNRS